MNICLCLTIGLFTTDQCCVLKSKLKKNSSLKKCLQEEKDAVFIYFSLIVRPLIALIFMSSN